MPIALAAAAWLLIMTGINGNYSAVGQEFQKDVFGSGSSGGFLNFFAGIIGLAIFFRVIGLPTVGKAFLILLLLVFILQNPNVLTALENVGGSIAAAPPPAPGSSVTGGSITNTVAATPNNVVATTGETSGTGSST